MVRRPTLGVLVAAHDEASVLPITLSALFGQDDPADLIIIADDGSRDATPEVLARLYGLAPPPLGRLSDPSPTHPTLRWLRLPHGGKARALNAALVAADTELVLTVDGDTLLDTGATAALREAFAANANLVAATGVLTPVCGSSLSGRFFQWFQTYEYIRNFLSRYAWHQMDALLLVSGAFAGFRRDAVLAVGGFDPACMVEDYELIHRLRRHGVLQNLGWTTSVVGKAKAITDAPATVAAFLRQRRRWFCGFLQTQFWYRDMVGNARYGRLGLVMLPIKALDTLQPLYGLTGFALLLAYLATGRVSLLAPVGGVILAKIAIDFAFHLWSIHLYRRWVDPTTHARLDRAILASLGRAVHVPGPAPSRRGARLGVVPQRSSRLGPPESPDRPDRGERNRRVGRSVLSPRPPLPCRAGEAMGGEVQPYLSETRMPLRLDSASAEFESAFKALLATKREVSDDVDQAVRAIIRAVRDEGDAALVRLSRQFDRVDLDALGLRVTAEEIAAAKAACRQDELDALALAHERIRSFHERQRPEDLRFTDALGVDLGWRWTAIQAVGLYVPGGTASYPSSVLMNAVPAKVAGCERLVMVVPAPDGRINPLVLAAADLAGVDEIYRVGGAQAIGALAYGTETIAPVMKIMGPATLTWPPPSARSSARSAST